MNTCLIEHGYRERAVGMCRHNHIRIPLVWFDERAILQEKDGYTRRIAGLHFRCSCMHKNVKMNSAEQHAIFAHELQSALRLAVGFWGHLL